MHDTKNHHRTDQTSEDRRRHSSTMQPAPHLHMTETKMNGEQVAKRVGAQLRSLATLNLISLEVALA